MVLLNRATSFPPSLSSAGSIAFPKSPSNELSSKSPRKVLLPAVVDRVPTLRTRQDFPARRFFQGKNDRAQGFSYEHRGEKVTSVVYDFSIVNPPADIAAQLGIAEDDFAYHIVRVRQADEKPIVIEYTYMPLELIPGLKKKDLYGSVYHFIREQCGLKISSFHRTIRAVAATEEEAERLDTKPGSPLLELTQIGFLDSGAAFEYSVSRNVGDRFELHNVTLA